MLQSYLENGDGTDSDKDNDPDVYFGGELSAVVGIVMLVVLLRMVQHVVIVPPSVLILQAQTRRPQFWYFIKVSGLEEIMDLSFHAIQNAIHAKIWYTVGTGRIWWNKVNTTLLQK